MARTAQISPKVEAAMNDQVRNELSSFYQYLAMASWLESVPLPGAAAWMRAQAHEELGHALRFFDFIVDRNGRVVLQALPQPAGAFASPLAAFEAAYRNEQEVTASIVGLYDLALQERDHVSHAFLQSFLTEQIEEEKTALNIVETLKMAGDSSAALLLVDRELGARKGGAGARAHRD